jgi:prolipoprotein diacylglyceryl transferase
VTTTVLAYISSPSQGVWHLGPVPIRAYALFIIVGIIAALVIGDRRWAARGGEPGVIYDIALWAVPFGLIGGRLYHVITDWRTYFGEDGAGVSGAFRIWDGGLGIWGAVALGGVGAWIGCRTKGIPLPAFGDAVAPGIILAQAIGRLGNYFNQELYGRPTTLPWGLEIYERRNANGVLDSLNGVSTGQPVEIVHPTFLYELLWNLLIFAALIWIDRRFKIGHGRLFATYVAGYCLGRFWIELMRSDVATHIAGIRVNSFTSTFVFVGAVVYIMVAPKGRDDPASLRGTPKGADETEDTAVEEFVKELTTVGAATGVVAAAKAAGEAEDEDAKAVADEAEPTSEAAAEAEELAEDVAEAPSEDIAQAAEFAEAGREAEEAEVAAEAEELGADVAGVPADNLAEAEEFAAEGGEEAEPESEPAAEPVGGVGSIEPEEAAEAEVAAAEAHEAAVEAADEAEEVAAEVSEEEQPAEGEAAAEEVEPSEAQAAEEAEPVGGVGAVEGEEAAEAEAAAPDAHEAALEAADEAEDVAAAVADEDSAVEPDEPETETEDAEAAVEAAEAQPSEEEAAEVEEAVVEEADAAADEEPSTGVLEAEAEPETTTTDARRPAEPSGGRLRRFLRRNR